MPRPKSFIKRMEIDTVKRAHKCQHSKTHKLLQGQKRLKLYKDRTQEYYCVDCAIKIISLDIQTLQNTLNNLNEI